MNLRRGTICELRALNFHQLTFRLRLARIAIALSVFLTAAGAEAQSAKGGDFLADYQVDNWTSEQGLPQNSIVSIAQTRDGYLWLATFNGLARFDGVRFVNYDTANTAAFSLSRFIKLVAAADGSLWIISEAHQLFRYKDGAFTAYGRAEGVPREGVHFAGEDPQGRMWFGAPGRYFRLMDGRLSAVAGGEWKRPGANVYFQGANAWAYNERDLYRVDPADLKRVDSPERFLAIDHNRAENLLGLGESALYRLEGDQWRKLANLPFSDRAPTSMGVDRAGAIWGVNWNGLVWRFTSTNDFRFSHLTTDPKPEALRDIYVDADENIWIGSNGGGLYRLKRRVIRTLTQADGLSGNVVKSVTQDSDGNLWAMASSTLNRISTDPPRVIEKIVTTQNNWVLQGMADGYLWAGGVSSGMGRRKNGIVEQATLKGQTFSGWCDAFHVDAAGQLWAAGDFGLARLNETKMELADLPELDLKDKPFRALVTDRAGNFYLGSSGYGLFVGKNDRWRQIRREDGLPDNNITALYADVEDGIWIGFPNHGLCRYKEGRIFCFPVGSGWPARSVYSIIEDDAKWLWFGSNQGLFRARRRDLDDFAEERNTTFHAQRFALNDGLGSAEFASGQQPTVCKTGDGRLWFATLKGIAVVDPKEITLNKRPPPVQIEESLADDQPVKADADGTFSVEPGRNRIEIHYTAFSFAAPRAIRFRVRMEGLEKDWVDVGTRRDVHYNRLRPGAYKFHVTACNNDGVWNQEGATMNLIMHPHFWETNAFRGSLVLLVIGLLAGVYGRELRALRKQHSIQEAFSGRLIESQESERKRMAAELHDGLGQKLQLIRNHALLALNRGLAADEAAKPLTQISNLTGEALNEVRAITSALRPAELDQVGLTRALECMIDAVASASGTRALYEIDPMEKLFAPIDEMNIYRIVQESLNNIIKHSRATEMTIELKRAGQDVTLTVFDNGKGFNPLDATQNPPGRTGIGLAGIRERVRILGGKQTVESTVGRGTRIVITIPLTKN